MLLHTEAIHNNTLPNSNKLEINKVKQTKREIWIQRNGFLTKVDSLFESFLNDTQITEIKVQESIFFIIFERLHKIMFTEIIFKRVKINTSPEMKIIGNFKFFFGSVQLLSVEFDDFVFFLKVELNSWKCSLAIKNNFPVGVVH
jgi:hypothetical protein